MRPKLGLKPVRYELVWTGVATLIAIALAFVPLFNVLGYELSAVYCIFVTLASAAIALRRLNRGDVSLGRQSPGEAYLALSWRACLPLGPPLLVALLNGLRVRNCDLLVGLELYLLLPVCSVLVVTALVLLASVIVKRALWRWLIYLAVIGVSIGASVWHLLTHPPIVAYHLTLGYFAGSIYDEALSIPPGLLPFRLYCLALVAAILAGIELGLRRRRGERLRAPATVFVVALGIGAVIHHNRFELQIESSRADIIDALGGRIESEHFVIYYPLSASDIADEIDLIVADHEYRWHQLSEFFGVAPEAPVTSFIYASRDQKQRLMGAGSTLIAKPWLREIHITYGQVGDGHLAHELAHVFTEPFGSGPLRLSGGNPLQMDVGLMEGAATAGAWDGSELTYHAWSAALYRLDLAPDLQDILGAGGFWTSYSRQVYTLAGSFCRWLIDTRGAEAFRRVYPTGDFEAVYDTTLDGMVSQWRAFLREFELTEAHLELARFRYDRPSIFGRPCARALADRARRAGDLAAGRRYAEAADCYAGVVADDPDNLERVLAYSRYLLQAGDTLEARRRALAVSEGSEASATLRAEAEELLGDIAWTAGDPSAAETHYARVAETVMGSGDLRRVTVKLLAATDMRIAPVVYDLLIATPPPPRDALTLRLAEQEARTRSWVLSYLLGLRLFEARDYARALRYLEATQHRFAGLEVDLPGFAEIARRTQFRRAQSLFVLYRLREAKTEFLAIAERGDPALDGWAAMALDWAERCDWAMAR